MNNTQISYNNNIINDLKNILIGYLEPLSLKFMIGQDNLSLDQVFLENGGMPLFLYDKQPFINQYIHELNTQNNYTSPLFFAQIVVERADPSYFGSKIEVEHNLTLHDNCIPEQKHYHQFVLALARNILSQESLIFNGEKVSLDKCWFGYDQFIKEIVMKQLQDANQNHKKG